MKYSFAALIRCFCSVPIVYGVESINCDDLHRQRCLSAGASITGPNSAPRWSTFKAPRPHAVVNVATESDVACVVQYAISRDIPFLAQNGGHGSATTLSGLKENGIVINLEGLDGVTYSSNKRQATIGGGVLTRDLISSGFENGVLFQTPTINCVGALGAMLGGGIGYLQGFYGLGLDTIVSMNVVGADGKAITVSRSQHPDLFFALRGAGPNFGIVTSAVIECFPTPQSGLQAFTGPLIFTSAQLEDVISALNRLNYSSPMAVGMIFANSGNVSAAPAIIVDIFYHGNTDSARKAFALLYDVKPVADRTAITSYNHWNDGGDAACVKGSNKPQWGVGLAQLDPTTWRKVYNSFAKWIKQPGAANSSVLMNVYSTVQSRRVSNSDSAYPFRDTIVFNAVWSAAYTSNNLDDQAAIYGARARDLWRSTSGLKANQTYINNAYGDESLDVLYGSNVRRLQSIKRHRDPAKRFNFWFPLS